MDVSRERVSSSDFSEILDLTANLASPKYSLRQFKLEGQQGCKLHLTSSTNTPKFACSLIVLEGTLNIRSSDMEYALEPEQGVHILGRGTLDLNPLAATVVFLCASAEPFVFVCAEQEPRKETVKMLRFAEYSVDKPWGWEKWYTKNVEDQVPYALKLIFMKKGHQSSLQSHVQKSETNFVISGRAEVLFGLIAPSDRSATIPIGKLQRKVYRCNQGWSNKIQELHRVIAQESYKAIEVSTSELDDVVRWADDANRPDGRIVREHLSSYTTPSKEI